MKMIFVDAENVGLKEVENIKTCIVDKVYVFSKVSSIKSVAEKSLFICLSAYPEGSNQADFSIIAYLSRILATLSAAELHIITFELYSNDKSLISAFQFQCNQLGAQCQIVQTKNDNLPLIVKESNAINIIYTSLKQPKKMSIVQAELGLTKQQMSKSVNELIAKKKIKRSLRNKREWVQC